MEAFEIPFWDGDSGADNLTHDLFRPHNVFRAKIAKKRKRNKYPRASAGVEVSNTLDKANEGKTAKVKNRTSKKRKTSDVPDQCSVSKNKTKPQDTVKSNNCGKEQLNGAQLSIIKSPPNSSKCDGNQPLPLTHSAASSILPSSPSSKHKKKKKKLKSSLSNEEKIKGDHNLKKVKDKLNLSVKLDSTDNKVSECLYSGAEDNKRDKEKSIIDTHINGNRSGVKNLKKSLVKENDDAMPSHRTKKKRKVKVVHAEKKNEVDSEVADNYSQNICEGESEKLTKAQVTDIHANLDLFPLDFHGSQKSKDIKKKVKYSHEKNSKVSKEVSSHLLKISLGSQSMKRRHSVVNDDLNKKRKMSEKDHVNPKYIGSQSINLCQDTDVVQQQVTEPTHVDGSKKSYSSINEHTPGVPKKKLTLRDKMMEKLRGSRFRFLNEQMYNSKSEETKKFFGSDRKSFEAYHEGYKQQLMQWPVKPVDAVIKYLKKKPTNYIIADFGCGDAKIAQSLPNLVHSFDYVALNDNVTACDMAHTPLSNGSVDVAVFCLSLMGSNLSDYISEANRVLKVGGILKIAEVESRFDNVEKFVRLICKYGFLCIGRDLTKDVFYIFDFKKEKNIKNGKTLPPIELRACSYKKR